MEYPYQQGIGAGGGVGDNSDDEYYDSYPVNGDDDDLEGGRGGGIGRNSDLFQMGYADVVEPVPDLQIDDGGDTAANGDSSNGNSMFPFFTTTKRRKGGGGGGNYNNNANNIFFNNNSNGGGDDNNIPSTRIAILKLMYRQYVASSRENSNDGNPQAVSAWALGKMLLLLLYFVNLMEQPLDYIFGTNDGANNTNNDQHTRRRNDNNERLQNQQQLQNQNDAANERRIIKGYIKTSLGVVHYMLSKPSKKKKIKKKTITNNNSSRRRNNNNTNRRRSSSSFSRNSMTSMTSMNSANTATSSGSTRTTTTTTTIMKNSGDHDRRSIVASARGSLYVRRSGNERTVSTSSETSSIYLNNSNNATTNDDFDELQQNNNYTDVTPIVCFHSSDRSSEEFATVLPLFASDRRIVLAIDVLGYGNSTNPTRKTKNRNNNNNNSNSNNMSCYTSIDDLATCLLRDVCDVLIPKNVIFDRNKSFIGIGSTDLGCYIATSILCRFPKRIKTCVLINLKHPTELAAQRKEQRDASSFVLRSSSSSLMSSSLMSSSSSMNHNMMLNNNNMMMPPLSYYSLTELRVLSNKVSNMVLEKEREHRGIEIQDVSTYDIQRDARRTIFCPILFVQIKKQRQRTKNKEPPPIPKPATLRPTRRKQRRVSSIEDMYMDDDGDDVYYDADEDDEEKEEEIEIEKEEEHNNGNSKDDDSKNSKVIKLFTEGGGSNTPIGITDLVIDDVINDDGDDNDYHNDGDDNEYDDLINENAIKFVSICEDFIQTML